MTKEGISITYENNIFYCTKNNTKWISVDGEKWYGEEKRIEELEQKLEQTEKDLADYQFNYPKIKELSKENAELKQQIEKMKCGQNCKHLYINLCDLNFRTCSNCKDKWEIKENE